MSRQYVWFVTDPFQALKYSYRGRARAVAAERGKVMLAEQQRTRSIHGHFVERPVIDQCVVPAQRVDSPRGVAHAVAVMAAQRRKTRIEATRYLPHRRHPEIRWKQPG
jgi:hypothetical protein